MSMHAPPHIMPNGGTQSFTMHTPWSQKGADSGHTFPQVPQLSGSELTGVQIPPQTMAPSTQEYTHAPSTHAPYSKGVGLAHRAPQLPQLSKSLARSAQ